MGLFKVWFWEPELSLSTVWSIYPVIVPLLEGEFIYSLFNIISKESVGLTAWLHNFSDFSFVFVNGIFSPFI